MSPITPIPGDFQSGTLEEFESVILYIESLDRLLVKKAIHLKLVKLCPSAPSAPSAVQNS